MVIALAVIMMLFMLSYPLSPVFGADSSDAQNQRTTVRIGYFNNGDFMHKDSDGNYEGYDIEYYYTLAGYAGWKIKVVEFANLDEATAGLKSGKIDVLSGLSKTPERTASFLTSSQKMCTAHIAVHTRAGDDRFAVGDTSTMKNMTCGILKGSNVVTLYKTWCGENDITPHVVEYDSLDARNAALKAGKVDAIAGGSTIEGAQKIAEFPSLDLYFMFNKKQAGLKSQIDKAMNILSLENPSYVTDLFAKYFPLSRNSKPSFSKNEKKFISTHSVVKVAVLANDAPFSYKDGDSAMGILPEYYAHLSGITGMKFKCVTYASKDKACEALYAGQADMVGKMEDDIYEANSRDVILSNSYLQMNMVRITPAGAGSIKSAAVPECNYESVHKALKKTGSTLKIRKYKNSTEAFKAMKSGETDSVICTQPGATWLLNHNRASEYSVSAFGTGTWNICCALKPDNDGNLLRSIIDKTVAVDEGYVSQIINRDTLEDSTGVVSFFNRMSVARIIEFAVFAAILLVILVIALIIIIRRRKTEEKLAAQSAELMAAEEANKARHAFFGMVSHDMRTPLNGIVGFTDLALKCDDPEKTKEYLEKIRTSGRVLTDLVSDTLVLSRLENDKYVLDNRPNDMAELLEEVLEPIRALAADKKVEFVDNIAQVCHKNIMVDRLNMQKIVLNLLSNAVKFTPEGGVVRFDCSGARAEDGSGMCVIRVEDTGIGVAEDFIPHMFDAFAQEDAANAGIAGSGMGLSIVKSIVDAMGGTIDVTSRKGKGTVFTVRLPVTTTEQNGDKEITDAGEVEKLRGMRALICEDNELNLEIEKAILENLGMEVCSTENGSLGVEIFEQKGNGYFNVVLLDMRMPVMDGTTAARKIRAMDGEYAATVPIIAVSADAYQENVEESLAAGMNAHVSKPLDGDEMTKLICSLVTTKKS